MSARAQQVCAQAAHATTFHHRPFLPNPAHATDHNKRQVSRHRRRRHDHHVNRHNVIEHVTWLVRPPPGGGWQGIGQVGAAVGMCAARCGRCAVGMRWCGACSVSGEK